MKDSKKTTFKLKSFIGKYFPIFLYQKRKKILDKEPILVDLPVLCSPDKVSIDVGCAVGTFINPLTANSSKVFAFEPNDVEIDYIKNIYGHHLKSGKLEFHNIGISNYSGVATLSIPDDSHALSSISPRKKELFQQEFNSIEQKEIVVKTIDEFNIKDVGFIKIDVEGHEYEVLEGAIGTIEDSLPTLYIEIEERHCPGNIKKIVEFLSKYNYTPFYFKNTDKIALDLNNFNFEKMQALELVNTPEYVNNFLFVQPELLLKIVSK
jgi:FkbM family methyltransferase